jgi:hypothetical protein
LDKALAAAPRHWVVKVVVVTSGLAMNTVGIGSAGGAGGHPVIVNLATDDGRGGGRKVHQALKGTSKNSDLREFVRV